MKYISLVKTSIKRRKKEQKIGKENEEVWRGEEKRREERRGEERRGEERRGEERMGGQQKRGRQERRGDEKSKKGKKIQSYCEIAFSLPLNTNARNSS